MTITNRKRARAAIQAGFMLVTFVQMMIKDKDTKYDMLIRELSCMGVDLDLEELKQIHEFPEEKFFIKVQIIKLRVYNSIERSCGPQIADWFLLSFDICYSISKGIKPVENEMHLSELAIRVGYPRLDFLHIIENIETCNPRELSRKFIDEALGIVKLPYIFISYATADREIAKEFSELFSERNISTFVASIDIPPSSEWEEQIREEIQRSDELLIILSPKAMESNWVMIEAGAAWILGKPITSAVLYGDLKFVPEPLKKYQAKCIKTTVQRYELVDAIAKKVYGE